MPNPVVIIIEPDGTARHLVDPLSERIASVIGPKIETRRSSHVETWHDLSDAAKAQVLERSDYKVVDGKVISHIGNILNNHFWVDLSPVGGGVLGPFQKYADAINAEVMYLQLHNLPGP